MKHYITEKDFEQLEEILMKAEIPYYVSFDSHINEEMTKVTYDKYIRIEKIVIKTTREA